MTVKYLIEQSLISRLKFGDYNNNKLKILDVSDRLYGQLIK
jgi:hypothetical protein